MYINSTNALIRVLPKLDLLCFHWVRKPFHPMENKPFFQLVVVFLGFSYLLTLGAVPLYRGPRSGNLDPSVVEMMMVEQTNEGEGMVMMDESFINRRMDFEVSNDYPGSGANNRHDPKPPGRS